jgi:hypothetical protein
MRRPLLAHSGHGAMSESCPLSGVKRTWTKRLAMSAFDPKRTLLDVYVLCLFFYGVLRLSHSYLQRLGLDLN